MMLRQCHCKLFILTFSMNRSTGTSSKDGTLGGTGVGEREYEGHIDLPLVEFSLV